MDQAFSAERVISRPHRGPLPYEENPQVPYPPVPYSFLRDAGGGPIPRGTAAARQEPGQKPVRAHPHFHPEGIHQMKVAPLADGSYYSNRHHGWYQPFTKDHGITPSDLGNRGFRWHANAAFPNLAPNAVAPYGAIKMSTL